MTVPGGACKGTSQRHGCGKVQASDCGPHKPRECEVAFTRVRRISSGSSSTHTRAFEYASKALGCCTSTQTCWSSKQDVHVRNCMVVWVCNHCSESLGFRYNVSGHILNAAARRCAQQASGSARCKRDTQCHPHMPNPVHVCVLFRGGGLPTSPLLLLPHAFVVLGPTLKPGPRHAWFMPVLDALQKLSKCVIVAVARQNAIHARCGSDTTHTARGRPCRPSHTQARKGAWCLEAGSLGQAMTW